MQADPSVHSHLAFGISEQRLAIVISILAHDNIWATEETMHPIQPRRDIAITPFDIK